ncbi:MAG: phenylalanine--tRNA ligase beta subunit-related protein [Patescibacteria group bacterium]
MKFSHKWLQNYFEDNLPEIQKLGELLTFHSFEIEAIEGDLIDIDILPNRSHDCLCYTGIAKEISVLTGLKLKFFDDSFLPNSAFKSEDFITLKIEDFKLVPRAMKRLVQDVKIGPSPKWLREKLESIGQKSINNVVDITNFVMWETGQPVHAFDFDKIAVGDSGKKDFIIRNAQNGEKIKTLDNHEFELDESILVISDKEKALDIAGMKGGLVSGIDENTKNIVLSVCNFNQTSIRRASRKLGLRTDASERFEKGITPEKVEEAMNRLSKMIAEIVDGKVSEDILDVYPRKASVYKVGFSQKETERLLGEKISEEKIEEILNRFGFKFEKIKPLEKILEIAPNLINVPYKSGASVVYDAPREFDCSSLTAYLFAQGGIAIPRISVDQYVFGNPISKEDLQAGDLVFGNTGLVKNTGIYTKTVEFLPNTSVPEGVDHVGLYLGENKILHTSSSVGKSVVEDMGSAEMFKNIVGYRRMILNDDYRYVVKIPAERLDLRIKEDLIEEIGRIYGYKNIQSINVSENFNPQINKTFYYINKIKKILVENGFSEVYTYTFGDKGEVEVLKPLASNLAFLRTNLSDGISKSLEMNLKNAPLLGLEEIKIFEIGRVYPSLDGEYTSLAIGVFSKKGLGFYDDIIKKLEEELNLDFTTDKSAFVWPKSEIIVGNSYSHQGEINLDEIIEKLPEPENYEDAFADLSNEIKRFSKISAYPFVLRDIAVWVSNENSANDLLDLIQENAGELLVQTKLFDTYAPEGEGRTSYAFNLVFQSQEKTLTDAEINPIMDKINSQIQAKGWEVR